MYNPLFTTPILFIIHNKSELTLKAFEEIRKIRPEKLYLSYTGYYTSGRKQVRLVSYIPEFDNKIDWDCKIETLQRKKKKNRHESVIESVDWFFDKETEGIILEDNCIATLGFFHFCSILLNVYRHDNSVGHIGGNNFFNKNTSGAYSFSWYPPVYGWATWRRAWNFRKTALIDFMEFITSSQLNFFFDSENEKYFFYSKFHDHIKNQYTNWVYLWMFSLWKKHQKSIIPTVNLVKISEAPTKSQKWLTAIPSQKISEVIHPDTMDVDLETERRIYEKLYKHSYYTSLFYKIKYRWLKNRYERAQNLLN